MSAPESTDSLREIAAFVDHLEASPGSLAFGRGKTLRPALLRALLAENTALRAERDELRKPKRDPMLNRSEEEWDALEDATMTVISLQTGVGHVLTEDDVAALRLVDSCQRNDEEAATDAFHRGREEGLRARGGDELLLLDRAADESHIQASVERTMAQLAARRQDEAEAQLAEIQERLDALAWFSGQHALSLEYQEPVYADDDDQTTEWRVYREHGGINDREWDLVGAGPTALEAILAARAGFASAAQKGETP
jgi:hypothetical protein